MAPHTLVHKVIIIQAPSVSVWNALTNNHWLQLWMSDQDLEIRSDWQAGSTIQMFGKANGNHEYKGSVLKSEPEKLLQYSSWVDISNLPDKPENYSIVQFELLPEGNSTQLTLTHSNLIADAAYEHSNFYWNTALQILKQMLEKKAL